MPNPIVHFEILGSAAADTKRFYTEMFDWKLNEIGGPNDYATVDTGAGEGAIGGGLGAIPDCGDFQPYVSVYVGVEDVEQALQQAEQLGGRRLMGPHTVDMPGTGDPFVIGQFADPDGRIIGLHAMA